MRTSIRIRQQQSLSYLQMPIKQKAKISKADAEVLLQQITSASSSMFEGTVHLMKANAHILFGFHKLSDLLRKKCDVSPSLISRMISSGTLFLALSPDMKYLQNTRESAFRPLIGLDLTDAQLVWASVIKSDPKRIRASDMLRAMEKLGIEESTQQKPVTICLDAQAQYSVNRYIKKISDSVSSQIRSQEEWKFFARQIYRQILDNHCPKSEQRPMS